MNTHHYPRAHGGGRKQGLGTAATITRQRRDALKAQKREDKHQQYQQMRNNAPSRRELRELENDHHNQLNSSQIGVTGRNTGYKVTKVVPRDSMQLEDLSAFFMTTDTGNADESVHVSYTGAGVEEEEQDVSDSELSQWQSPHGNNRQSAVYVTQSPLKPTGRSGTRGRRSSVRFTGINRSLQTPPNKRSRSSRQSMQSFSSYEGMSPTGGAPPTPESPADLPPRVVITPRSAYRGDRRRSSRLSYDSDAADADVYTNISSIGDIKKDINNGTADNNTYVIDNSDSFDHHNNKNNEKNKNNNNGSSSNNISSSSSNNNSSSSSSNNDDGADGADDGADDGVDDGNESDISSSMSLESRLSGESQVCADGPEQEEEEEEEVPLRNKGRRRSEAIKVVTEVVPEVEGEEEEREKDELAHVSVDDDDDNNGNGNDGNNNDVDDDDDDDDNDDYDMGGGFDDFGGGDDDNDDDDQNDHNNNDDDHNNHKNEDDNHDNDGYDDGDDDANRSLMNSLDESRVEVMNESVDMSFKKPNRITTVTKDDVDDTLEDEEEEEEEEEEAGETTTAKERRRRKRDIFYEDWNPNASRGDADLDTTAYVKADGWFDPKDPSGKGKSKRNNNNDADNDADDDNYNNDDNEYDAQLDDVNNKSLMSGEQFDARPGDLTTELSQRDVARLPKGRPCRRRMRPLEWWRNERVVYKRGEQVCEVKRVIVRSPAVAPRINSRTRARKDKIPEAPSVINPNTGEEDNQMTVVVGRKEVQHDLGKDTNQIRNVVAFDEDNFVSGKILIRPGSRTKRTNRTNSTECFYVISGTVSVNLHNSDFELNAGGFFYVPKGNWFRLSNRHKSTVSLAFFMARGE